MILLQTILCTLLFSCGNSHQDKQAIAYDNYVITKATDGNKVVLDYLYYHLNKRTEKGVVLKQGVDVIPANSSSVQFIDAIVDSNLSSDYEIVKKDNKLTFKANSKKTLYWLFYQYFQALSENDSKMNADDLPPAIVSFKDSKEGNFAFKYREPYLKANLVEGYDVIINTNSVEKDWGIWGHQLFNIVNKNPKNEYYSVVNGEVNKKQLCFGNPETYSFLENYIINNFGEKESYSQNFVIGPADNGLVCTCSYCTKLGNTKNDASFSVIALVNKLANRFPTHTFLTIDYISVKTPPTSVMPKNTAIIISSINIPRKFELYLNNGNLKEFESKVTNWKKVCPSVYVWDYISNFDDYLTPYAPLSICKINFSYYKKLKVNGVFANGAGYDYSTFNAVHTYVIGALMQDPSLDINQLVSRYCNFYYGESGQIVADYILGLEKTMQKKNYNLDLYNGVKKMTGTYLNNAEFFDFYTTIKDLKDTGNEEVVNRMNQLYTALTFSAMQIQLANRFDEDFGFATLKNDKIQVRENFKERFTFLSEQHKKNDIFITREREGNVTNYLKEVKKTIIDGKYPSNLLNQKTLTITSELDESYTDATLLTDGIPGLTSDYHNAWLIVSAHDLTAKITAPKEAGKYHFKFNFLLDERLNMRAPDRIEVLVNNKIAKTILPEKNISEGAERLTLESTVVLEPNDVIKIKIYRDKTLNKFACDEIYLYK
ncbi:DUF4838 domain-containing protein [Flavobacterium sp. SM2513]|uniref:DUF4838 domain-containing protein n=1 Tax=Flavobacterium sp. SM2513 TaxID=3424766 RepID=UPI003D7FAAEA